MSKSALELIHRGEKRDSVATQPHQEIDVWGVVEIHIDNFCESQAEFCQKAKEEGWLGHRVAKNHLGLLGYLRNGFAIQLKTLNQYNIPLPIWYNEFVGFFRSDWFRSATRKNGFIKPIYKKEHFDLIKKFNL
jgi:hypothetical protein